MVSRHCLGGRCSSNETKEEEGQEEKQQQQNNEPTTVGVATDKHFVSFSAYLPCSLQKLSIIDSSAGPHNSTTYQMLYKLIILSSSHLFRINLAKNKCQSNEFRNATHQIARRPFFR